MQSKESEQNTTTYKATLAVLISLSIPTILEEILSTLLQYVDTAMVGQLGENATAAVSTTTTIGWLIYAIPAAISVAMLAMASKANGAGDSKLLKKISAQAVFFSISVGLILEFTALVLSPFIPIWMGADINIQKEASAYFAISSITLFLRTSARIFASMIRATKDTKTPMIITISENLLNVGLNYLFIYTLNQGVAGAAIASAISYGIGGLAMFIALFANDALRFSLPDLKPDKSVFKKVVHIGGPALCTNVASCLGYVVFAAMVSGMGTTIFAAHSIAVTAEEIVYIPGYGLRSATSTLIGNALGEKNWKKLKMTKRLSILITMLIMIINGVLLYLFAYPLMTIFTSSSAVALLGSKMLKLVAFSEPFFGLMIVMEGISYGLGKTKHVFYCEAFSMWFVRILSTFVCVKILGLSLTYVWLCMIADNICKAILLVLFRPRQE